MSDSLGCHRLQPAWLLCPWNFPGENTGVDCHFLLQGVFPTQDHTEVSYILKALFNSVQFLILRVSIPKAGIAPDPSLRTCFFFLSLETMVSPPRSQYSDRNHGGRLFIYNVAQIFRALSVEHGSNWVCKPAPSPISCVISDNFFFFFLLTPPQGVWGLSSFFIS